MQRDGQVCKVILERVNVSVNVEHVACLITNYASINMWLAEKSAANKFLNKVVLKFERKV